MPAGGPIGALAAIAAPVLVAATLATTGTARPATTSALRPVVSYPITVSFDVRYEVRWSEGEESVDPCASWETRDGTLDVRAQSVGRPTPFRGFIALNRPRSVVVHGGSARDVPVWAELTAVGEAEGTVRRTLAYEGGPRFCPGTANYVPPVTDCRGTRVFDASLTRQPATVIAGFRPQISSQRETLDYTHHMSTRSVVDGKDIVSEPFNRFRQALFIVVKPERALYRRCPATRLAPEYPIFVALDVLPADWRALAALRPGRRHVLQGNGNPQVHAGECTVDDVGTDECSYELSIRVIIRRVR